MTSRSVAASAFALVALMLTGGNAEAQSRTGFAVDRFEPAERGSDWFALDTLDLRGPRRIALGTTLDYAYKPLVVEDAAGVERYALVRHQLVAHTGASVSLGERVRIGASVPFALYQDGEPAVVAGESLGAATAPAIGDVRLAGDVRVAGRYGDPITVAAGMRAWLPTGLRSQFTGDGSMRGAPQVLASGEAGAFVWSARVAFEVRPRDGAYAGEPLGSALSAAGAAGVRALSRRLLIGVEGWASSTVTGGGFLRAATTPVEAVLGAHVVLGGGVRAGAGIGTGVTPGFGAPRMRALAVLEWAPGWEPPAAPAKEPDEETFEFHPPPPIPRPEPPPPLAEVTETEIRIGEEIRFATDSAELLADSDAVLAAVKRVLDQHPELRRIRVEGHTDAVGDARYNEDLSERRARSVATWLVDHGVDASRVESKGYGASRPIASNDTEQGRARNRRVVFTILEREPAR